MVLPCLPLKLVKTGKYCKFLENDHITIMGLLPPPPGQSRDKVYFSSLSECNYTHINGHLYFLLARQRISLFLSCVDCRSLLAEVVSRCQYFMLMISHVVLLVVLVTKRENVIYLLIVSFKILKSPVEKAYFFVMLVVSKLKHKS